METEKRNTTQTENAELREFESTISHLRNAPKTARGLARRLRVLTTAERLFSERGFDAVSINEIVREAGGSLSTIYQWYDSKDDLFFELFLLRTDRIGSYFRSLKHTGRGAEADIDAAIDALCSNLPYQLLRSALLESRFLRKYNQVVRDQLQKAILSPLGDYIARSLATHYSSIPIDSLRILNLIVRYLRGSFFELILNEDSATKGLADIKDELKRIVAALLRCEG